MEHPLVSVILPTFNCADVLSGCLDSIVAQDYPSLEILVMDGGSNDETVAVAQGYGERVRVVSERDRGIYDAMNKGIAAARGEWLYFIGADDRLAGPDVVRRMMASEHARDRRILMLYGDVDSPRLGPRYRGRTSPLEIRLTNICHQAIFYRRRLFEIEPPYDLRYRLYGDWDLNLRVYYHHPRSHRYVDLLVAHYADGSSSAVNDEIFLGERLELIARYARESRGVAGREVRAHFYAEEIAGLRAIRYRGDMLRRSIEALKHSALLRMVIQRRIHNPWRDPRRTTDTG